MNVDVPGLDHGLRDTLEDGLMGGAAQRDGAGERPRVRLVAAEHGLEQVNDSQIVEPRYRHVCQSVTDRNEAPRADCRENAAGDPSVTRRWPPDGRVAQSGDHLSHP